MRVRVDLQRECRQSQARRPALRALAERVEVVVGQRQVEQLNQLARLHEGEGEILRAHLGHATGDPQPLQPQQRIRPGQHDEPQPAERVVEQGLEVVGDGWIVDFVEVVEHERDRVALRRQRLDERG